MTAAASLPRKLLLLLPLGLVAGLLSWWAIERADREMRAELRQQARLVGQGLHLDAIRALTGAEADLAKPEYEQLKERLMSMRSANAHCRFLYLMGRKADGTVFFYIDSEPDGSKDNSPPGQVYDEVPAAARRAFDTRAEDVTDPTPDRWGVWVTALVPLTDPQTGAVLTVLGMDIAAGNWKADVAVRAALPVGLMVVLLIGAAAAVFATGGTTATAKPVMRRLLTPLLIMVTLIVAGAGLLLRMEHRQSLAGDAAGTTTEVAANLTTILDRQAELLSAAALRIGATDVPPEAWHDPDRLLAAARPVLEALQRENQISQLSFLDRNRDCRLRVHAPEKRGDRIDRFTALEAERTHQAASGLELEPSGACTLRVVHPIEVDGALVGYIELGKEIGAILPLLHRKTGVELAAVVRKELLDPEKWDADSRRLGSGRRWDRLRQNVLIYGRLPETYSSGADPVAGESAAETSQEISVDGQDWLVTVTPLANAEGKEIGDVLILRDISTEKADFARLLVLGGAVGGVVLVLLFSLIYVLLRRTDAGIRAQQAVLQDSLAQADAARHEVELQRAAVDQHAIVCVTDMTGTIQYVNAKFREISGYAQEELLGQNHRLLNSGHHPAEFWRECWQTIQPGNIWHREICNRARSGALYWVSSTVVPLRNQAGVVERFVAISTNITESKAHATALHAARQAAEMANSAKGEFLATMSHEIRTPMNGVLGFTDLLLESPLSPEQRQFTNTIKHSGEALLTIINDILDYSKIESGKFTIEQLPCDFAQTIEEVAALLAVRAREKSLELRLEYGPEVPRQIVADPTRLRQIVVNLVGNAVKFTERGRVTLRVSVETAPDAPGGPAIPDVAAGVPACRPDDFGPTPQARRPVATPDPAAAGARFLRIEVIDTGIGLTPEQQGRLFQKFSQADSSTTRRYGGSGLGLAICKQLAELMGGRIGLTSEPGKGSTFWFAIPLVEVTATAPSVSRPATNPPMPATTRTVPDQLNLRVLVAEDNAVNQVFALALLRKFGCQAEIAPTGREAVELFCTRPFDVILMDCHMPEMDGYEATALIRQFESRQPGPATHIPIIAVTASAMVEDHNLCLAAGMDAFLTKPLRAQHLKQALAQWAPSAAPEVARSE